MNAKQTAFDIAERGGTVEAIDGDRMVVSSGSTNNVLHFVLGLCTFGLWWVFVWAPKSVAGGRKRRVVYANTPTTDVRLPHELPWPTFTILSSIVLCIVLYVLTANVVLLLLAVIVWACVLRALANR
jgi:hypothetical protein